MGIIRFTENKQPRDPLADLAWNVYKGYEEQPDNLSDSERLTIEKHIKRFAEQDTAQAEKCKAKIKAEEELRSRIEEHEKNLSPEAKECWDAMQGLGYEDPIHDCREAIRQGIINRYNLHEQIKALEKTNPAERTRQMRANQERKGDKTDRYSPLMELDDLKKHLADCERMLMFHENHLKELLAEQETCRLQHDQEAATLALCLLFKFTADESVRRDIEDKTRTVAEEWKKWQGGWREYERYDSNTGKKIGTDKAPSSFTEIAERLRHNLSVYEHMLNGYAEQKPINDAALASQKECAALESRFNTMNEQFTLKINEAKEQARREKQSEIMKARALTKRRQRQLAPLTERNRMC